MKWTQRILVVITLVASVLMGAPVNAQAPPTIASPASLSLAELKITGDEFVVLQNNTGATIDDLSSYWLDAFNNTNPLAAGVSSSTQQLPALGLGMGQRLLLSATAQLTCGAAVAGKLNLSLTDSGGFLELVQMNQTAGGAVTQIPGDVVSWNSGTSGVIQSVPSSTKDPKAAYYRYLNTNGFAWQQADLDPTNSCQLNVVVASGSVAQSVSVTPLAAAATSPPATTLAVDSASGTTVPTGLPPADLGLLAPQISELLPNPMGAGNDATDEFLELYNPNKTNFDLSGFSLQVGTTAIHTYTFPAGSSLQPQAFAAFYSSDTSLSLSNSGGQAALLDPLGTVVNQADVYGSAKDGVAWALEDHKWFWTTKLTPGLANIITQPISAKAKKTSSKITSQKSTTSGKVKGASTSIGTSPASQNTAAATALRVPIHPWILALVAVAALLYGAYEYRTDIANRINQFRTNRADRSPNR